MPLKPLRATVANANSESVKSLHTLLDTYLDFMLETFEPSHTVRNVQNLSFWTQNRVLLKLILTSAPNMADPITMTLSQ